MRCRAAIRLGTCALLVLGACRKTAPEPRDAGTSPAVVDAEAPDPCPPLPDGAVTEEDHPTIRATGKPVDGHEWLEARGVSRATAAAWQTQRYGRHPDLPVVLAPCTAITIGTPEEEAIVCEIDAAPSLLMAKHGVVLAVRHTRIAVAFDVGLALLPLDFEGTRDFDQTLTIEADGVHASVTERAPGGSTLVESRAACHARYARAAPGSPPPPPFGLPAKLNGCEAAQGSMRTSLREMSRADPETRKELRDASAFLDRSCLASGPYVWAGGQFVRRR